MSVSIYLTRPRFPEEVVPVVGNNELRELWLPIVRSKRLHYLEYTFSAGLLIDDENYKCVIEEISTLLAGLNQITSYVDDIVNPLYRCRRLLQLLKDNSPNSGAKIYIG